MDLGFRGDFGTSCISCMDKMSAKMQRTKSPGEKNGPKIQFCELRVAPGGGDSIYPMVKVHG